MLLKWVIDGKIGNGNTVRFWEDTWCGTSLLSIQYFDLYVICNEHGKIVAQVWDGSQLKLSFRKNFNSFMMDCLYELEGPAYGICYSEDCDALIWQYTQKGVYATTTFCNIINFGGVTPSSYPLYGNYMSHQGSIFSFGS
jgi:hypothetical protein